MRRLPPRSQLTAPPVPDTPPFRSERIALIECDDDPLIDPSMPDEMAARYGDSARHRISGGEHYPAVLKPDRYNAILRDFHATLAAVETARSEEHTSELQSLMRISYAVFCLNNTNSIRTYLTQY